MWKPTATLNSLHKRAELLAQIRSFFSTAGLLEVDTPILGAIGVTDIHIENIEAQVNGQQRFLQSSPEYFMKRLLAAGSGPIYSLGKVFRDGESGNRHNPEFTLLEWYRPGWDEHALIEEISRLMAALMPQLLPPEIITYRQVFKAALGVDPHRAQLADLQQLAADTCGRDWLNNWSNEDRSTCLDLLFSLKVEPALPRGLVYITEYPACQSALARLKQDDQNATVARRFEVFINGMEVGNGYFELIDPEEQLRRFNADISQRKQQGKKVRAIDQRLLSALEEGLPECAGVAIGVDRLLMQILEVNTISQVLPFTE